MAFFFKLLLSLVSFANKILFADGFVNFSSSQCTALSLDGTVMFSFSPRDSFSVLFLLRHFGVPSALCSLVLISYDDFMSVIFTAFIWSLLASELGPVLMPTAGLAHAMSPYTFLLPSNGFYDKIFEYCEYLQNHINKMVITFMDPEIPYTVFSLFISSMGKIVFQTGKEQNTGYRSLFY